MLHSIQLTRLSYQKLLKPNNSSSINLLVKYALTIAGIFMLEAKLYAQEVIHGCAIYQCSHCTIKGVGWAIERNGCTSENRRHRWNQVGYDKECEKEANENKRKQQIAQQAEQKAFEARKAKNSTKNGEPVFEWYYPSGLPKRTGNNEKYTVWREGNGSKEQLIDITGKHVILFDEQGNLAGSGLVSKFESKR